MYAQGIFVSIWSCSNFVASLAILSASVSSYVRVGGRRLQIICRDFSCLGALFYFDKFLFLECKSKSEKNLSFVSFAGQGGRVSVD